VPRAQNSISILRDLQAGIYYIIIVYTHSGRGCSRSIRSNPEEHNIIIIYSVRIMYEYRRVITHFPRFSTTTLAKKII